MESSSWTCATFAITPLMSLIAGITAHLRSASSIATKWPILSGLVEIANNGKFKLDLRYFRHHTANVSYSWNNCAPELGKLYRDEMAELLGSPRDPDAPLEQRHKDLARSAQIVYEEAFFALLLALHRRYPVPNLALSGGCAMNSVANGKVYLRTPFRKMYLPAAAVA